MLTTRCCYLSRIGLSLLVLLALAGCSSEGDTNGASGPAATPGSQTADESTAYVLALHSYHAEYLWEQELIEGILDGLEESGYSAAAGNLLIDHFWMDTKRNTSEEYFASIAKQARQYILETKPDVVIATDNNAIRLVVATWPDDEPVPFVYAGLNDMPGTYGLDQKPNVTGVLERAHVGETLQWIESVLPDAKRVTVLADDSTTTAAYMPEVKMQLGGSRTFGDSQMYATNSYAEWQELVLEACETSDALIIGTYSTIRDENDRSVPSSEVMEWTVNHSTIPVVAFWEFGVEEGALGGAVISGQTQGHEAALKAARILNGESPADILVTTPQHGKLALNTVAAARWGIQFPLALIEVSTLYDANGVVQSR